MNYRALAFAIPLAFASAVPLSGCDRTANLTEQEHLLRAKDFEDKGNLKGSVVELKNAIQKNPDGPQARLLLGQVYLKLKLGAEAEKELTKAEKLGVNRESIRADLGDALLLMKDYKRVLEEIQPGDQTSKPSLARILQIRGDALLGQGKLKEGCSLFQQSLETEKNNVPTYWGLAQCAVIERDMARAKDWLDAALKLNSKQAETWVFIGDLEYLKKNTEAAVAAYSSALTLAPDDIEALQSRATIHARMGRLEPAQVDLDKIRKLAPKSLAASYLTALVKFQEKKLPEARDAVQEALRIAPDHLPSLLLDGQIEFALHNLQTAEAQFARVLRQAPRNVAALRMLAATQLLAGRPDDATRTLAPFDLEKVTDAGILDIAGKIALAKREYTRAATLFEKAAGLSPTSPAIRTELGLARLAQGDSRAMGDLQAAANLGGSDNRADNVIILNQLRQKQLDAALKSIDALEKKQPQDPLPWNYRGATYLLKKDSQKARNSFEQALRLDAKFFPAAANLAKLDLADGNAARARQRFEKMLEADPAHLEAMLALADLSLGDKDEKAYLTWLQKAAQAHPRSLLARETMIRYFLGKGDHKRALAIAQDTANVNPDSPAALNLLGNTQMRAGEKTKAIATFTTLTKKANQSPDAFLRLAFAHIANKDSASARAALQSALRLKPDHLQSQDALLRLELVNNKRDTALRMARQIQVQHPDSPVGFDHEGDILFAQKRVPQAIKAYEQALAKGRGSAQAIKLFQAELRSGNTEKAEQRAVQWLQQRPDDQAARAYLAEFYMAAGRNKEAIAHYQMMQRRTPDDVLVLNNLATLYQREKDSRALVTAEQALKLAPDDPSIQDTLGWTLVEQGKAQQGLALLRKALAKTPRAATVRYHHAVALVRTGKRAEARKELEKLLSEAPKFPESGEAQALLSSL